MLPPALLLLLAASPQHAWPQFGGPDRDGVVAESGWSATGAEEPLWRREVGLGYSCPSIVDGRLVTTGFHEEAEEDVVLCLDAGTGEELWAHPYPATDAPRYHGGGTLTTPTIADGVVYTLNRHGRAFALDLESGEVLWERDHREELGLEPTFHGFCASPIVLEDRIVHVLGGTAAAVERAGGALIWRTEDHGDGGYANATAFELGGRTLVAAMLAQTLYVLDVEDGAVVYELDWPLQGNAVHCAQPLVIGDRLLLSTAYGKGAAMLQLGEAREPELLWASRELRNKVTGVYLFDEHLYGFDESMLKCFDLEGNETWRVRGLGMGALSIAGGRLLIVSSKGELVVAEATPEEFRELSRRKVLDGGSYWTMPVLVDGRIYVRSSLGELVCLDHRQQGGASAGVADVEAAPAAQALFDAHAAAVGGASFRDAAGLRLTGEWEILGRGMSRTPATLLLGAPNRWRLGLDAGSLVHTFDGEHGWELKNGGARLFDEAEAADAPRVHVLAELFAPSCPDGAVVRPAPVSFAGLSCWRVDSPMDAERALSHYFAVEDGRLVGREGDALSTVVFGGALPVGDARVPERIVLYRAGSGQEESFYVSGAEWLAPDDAAFALFERPDGVLRLLRTPEQRAADTVRLRETYARELGEYRFVEGPFPLEDMTVTVEDGDLLALGAGERLALVPLDGEEDAFQVGDIGAELRFERADDGAVTGARMSFGPDTARFEKTE